MHVSWPPPDPPLLSYNAPLASQGRAQLGSRPSLGGPLSPSAQLIPPPAPQCRSIPGVMTRCRYGSATWRRNVPRYRGHAKCVPDTVPDWLLAPGQTKWGARYGPCRWRDKRKCPFRYKGGPGGIGGRSESPLPSWTAEPRSKGKTISQNPESNFSLSAAPCTKARNVS